MNGPPFVIAHRGASGYLPEHTREAKVLAYGQGADYLEQDVVAAAGGELVVLHDIYLDEVTDVALRFPERRRGDGRFYVIDFALDELRTLRIKERRRKGTDERVFPERFADDTVEFRIVTFDEELRLVRALNATTGRVVGVYPEIKAPAFHHQHGIDLAARVLETLERYGYAAPDSPAVVQCFEEVELRRCRHELGTRLKLAQLTDIEPPGWQPDLGRIVEYAEIWAPHFSSLVQAPEALAESSGGGIRPAEAARAAKAAGLEIHPWTFRRDAVPSGFSDIAAQLEFFYGEVGVDAVFCDHPDIAVQVRAQRAARVTDGQRPAASIE